MVVPGGSDLRRCSTPMPPERPVPEGLERVASNVQDVEGGVVIALKTVPQWGYIQLDG